MNSSLPGLWASHWVLSDLYSLPVSSLLTLEEILFDPFGWTCIDSVKQTSAAVYARGALSDQNLYSTVKTCQREPCSCITTRPRPLQQSGRKVMFSVGGNNKNNLKWGLIHYSLSSGRASPLFPPFLRLFMKAFLKVCAPWFWISSVHSRSRSWYISYLFWAAFI